MQRMAARTPKEGPSDVKIYAKVTYNNGRPVAGVTEPEEVGPLMFPLLHDALRLWLTTGEAESVTVQFQDTRVKFTRGKEQGENPGESS